LVQAVMIRQRAPQRGQSGVLGIEGESFAHEPDGRLLDVLRRRQVRLAEVEAQHAVHSHRDLRELANPGPRHALDGSGNMRHVCYSRIMSDRFRLAGITDEFSPDIEVAVRAMAEVGMTGAELRMIFGKNILDLTDEELDRAIAIVRGAGHEIVSIASPLLKCVLPDAPEVDSRFQQDMFASRHTFADQPRLAERAFEIADRTGARIIRVFSYWRTVRPEQCFRRVVEALGNLAEQAKPRSVTIGIENEHACHIGTGAETAQLLASIDHSNLKVVWDPANALVAGETPF